VTCSPQRSGAASVSFAQRILRRGSRGADTVGVPFDEGAGSLASDASDASGAPDALLAEADVRVACVDAQTFRPQRLPQFLIDILQEKERA